jgi:hypothetical protein
MSSLVRRALAYLVMALSVESWGASVPPETPLEEGFRNLYNLSFAAGHSDFEGWERTHPDDPTGPVFDAAAYLFAEFHRLNVLQSEFFTNDETFEDRKLRPDPEVKHKFEAALDRSRLLADSRLKTNPDDEVAQFAIVMRLGLHADYLSLLEHRDMDALKETKQGRVLAERLVAEHPDCYDAYIAIGVENYLLSLKPAPVRWFLHFGGAQTDKETGIAKLRLTAKGGHYLQPYAELLLAVAALRDKNQGEAKRLLGDLSRRFPGNTLYRAELAKLQ